jgi:hypothetical protein
MICVLYGHKICPLIWSRNLTPALFLVLLAVCLVTDFILLGLRDVMTILSKVDACCPFSEDLLPTLQHLLLFTVFNLNACYLFLPHIPKMQGSGHIFLMSLVPHCLL